MTDEPLTEDGLDLIRREATLEPRDDDYKVITSEGRRLFIRLLAERKAWIERREVLRQALARFLDLDGNVNDVIDAALETVGGIAREKTDD